MKKIYLAAHFERRPVIRPVAARLWELGYELTSSWLNETTKPEGMAQDVFFKKLAIKDLSEIRAADILILDTHEPSERGGKEVEFGFALGHFQGKQVWIVGPKRNVFHELADLVFNTWDQAIEYLDNLQAYKEGVDK